MVISLGELFHLVQLILLRTAVMLCVKKRTTSLGSSILVIAPHPDDEIFGAGGIIIAALEQKQTVHILYLTDGEGNGVDPDPDRIHTERMKMSETVRVALGLPSEHLHRFHLSDGSVPRMGEGAFDQVAERLAILIDNMAPETVLATHALDYWPYDHVACAELAKAAVKRSQCKPTLYGYWVWAWYNLRPWQLFTCRRSDLQVADITPWFKAKQQLVDIYLNSTNEQGKPWSGVLPAALRRAFRFRVEVLEKIEI